MNNLFITLKTKPHNFSNLKLTKHNFKQPNKPHLRAVSVLRCVLVMFFITFALSIMFLPTATLFFKSVLNASNLTTISNSAHINAFALNATSKNTSTNKSESANENYFAQIQNKNVYLYSTPLGTPLFEVPETYYVKLLEKSKNGFYKAQYINIVGYIKEDEIQCVANPPATPFLATVSFRNYGAQSSELRTEPTRLGGSSTLICELPLYETNFTFYGKISGEEVVPNRSDIWFYCAYTKNNQTKQGYIYSGLIDMITQHISNPIDPYPILKHEWKEDKQTQTAGATLSLPNKKQTLILLIITIPIIALVALMFKPMQAKKSPSKSSKNNKNNNAKSIRTITLENPRYTATTLNQTSPFKQQSHPYNNSASNRNISKQQNNNFTSPNSNNFAPTSNPNFIQISTRSQPSAQQNYFKQTRTTSKKGKDFFEL